MRKPLKWFSMLAAVGLAAGLLLAVLGVPYGRWNPAAFAELYHGPTNTDGTIHMAVDCDIFSLSTEDSCSVPGTDTSVAISIGNSTGATVYISTFNFRLTNDSEGTFDPVAGADANLNGNPDYVGNPSTGWSCAAPPPNPDEDPAPNVSVSFLSCNELNIPNNRITLQNNDQHIRLAEVHFDNVNPPGGGTSTLTLSDVNVFDDALVELMSCNPVNTTAGPCFGATIANIPPPTTHPNDYDFDGVLDSVDNCPSTHNPDQLNSDGNFISNAPAYGIHDVTRANSDNLGDACDNDDDNDVNPDHYEECCMTFSGVPPCTTSPHFQTSPTNPDTDGDRFRDWVECQLGSHPYINSSTPPVESCGSTTDADLDGLNERLEFCFYGTDASAADSDFDFVKDGCEAASLNGDTVVNSGDQGLLAAEMVRAVPQSQKLVNFDITKDGIINSGDQGVQASRFGKCP